LETRSTPPGAAWDRGLGVALFSFIPATLVLLLRQPFGPGASLALAAAVIVAHRVVASRFVYRRAGRRCLWCGGAVRGGVRLSLKGVPGLSCCAGEEDAVARFLSFVADHALALRVAILGTVALYALLGVADALGAEVPSLAARAAVFRGVIAAAVVWVALAHRSHAAKLPASFPFPIHNLALLGARWTLRVFLAVGTAWLALTAYALGRWLGG